MGKEKVIVIGTGHSVNAKAERILEKRGEYDVLAFQGSFPHCEIKFGITPDYWTAADPYAFLEGLQYIIENKKKTNITILLPSIFGKDLNEYRKYCGTSPIMRVPNGWEILKESLNTAKDYCNIEEIPTTSTKFIKLHSKDRDLKDNSNIFGSQAYYRFMCGQVLFGSIPFDSESVIGEMYKWGLENKITSSVLPICYHRKYKEVYITGFDLFGPRFYNEDSRHPWGEGENLTRALQIPLDAVRQWSDWSDIHNMAIYNISNKDETLLSRILETKEI